jgi:hypothetical protein
MKIEIRLYIEEATKFLSSLFFFSLSFSLLLCLTMQLLPGDHFSYS